MFSESLEHMLSVFVMEGYIILGVDSHVIHIDLKPLLWEHICKDMVHESLEGGGGVAESKEHDSGFEESHGGNKSGLPLIFLPDVNVVISPTNIKFGEQGGLFHVIDEFQDEGEGIGILDSVGVQVAAILARAKGSILLWYKEEGGGLGGFRGYDMSCLKMFFNKGFTCFHFYWIERINFGDLGGEVWAEFNGMVIGAMRWELVMGFL